MELPFFTSYFGVDFSGGRLAGRNIWVARCEVADRRNLSVGVPTVREGHALPSLTVGTPTERGRSRLTLVSLDRLEDLAGTAEREPALAHLVALMRQSTAALWGCDFPFGLPLELFPAGHRWPHGFDFLREYADDAYRCGLECVRRAGKLKFAEARKTKHHVRRVTDLEAKAPFDTFHYRMVH